MQKKKKQKKTKAMKSYFINRHPLSHQHFGRRQERDDAEKMTEKTLVLMSDNRSRSHAHRDSRRSRSYSPRSERRSMFSFDTRRSETSKMSGPQSREQHHPPVKKR